jgi:hypothetical protein
MAPAGSHAASQTEARCRHRSRRQKLDLAVRVGFVVLAVIVLLYDKAHDRVPRSEDGLLGNQQASLLTRELPARPAGHRLDCSEL